MQSIEVLTTQNVKIRYPLASIGDRILAFIIDSLIMFAYGFLVIFSLASSDVENIYVYIVLVGPLLFYHLLFETFMEGQSIGKRQMKIKVIKMDGSRPGIGAYLIRWLLRPIDNLFYGGVAMVTISMNGKGQRLGDLAAGTSVIKLKEFTGMTSSPLKQSYEEQYEVVYQEAFRLQDADMGLIDQALEFNLREGNPGPANLLAEKLAEKMEVKLDVPPLKFLHTVKKDYYHLTSK